MKIKSLCIENYKAIKKIELTDLENMVIIAGPNGCGKSCVLDAIRLLKSSYGEYERNEYSKFFGEFQINLQSDDLLKIFQNKEQPVVISGDFYLSAEEKEYLAANKGRILREILWKRKYINDAMGEDTSRSISPEHQRRWNKIDAEAALISERITEHLENDYFEASLTIKPDKSFFLVDSPLAEVVFSTYEPEKIGIFDYHGASRNYSRQNIGGIKVNIQSDNNSSMKNHALYDYNNKYSNLKSEMAQSYVKSLIIKDADIDAIDEVDDITSSLNELFSLFFSGKSFSGPQPTPDGKILFHVTTPSGYSHDIDDLSLGEKEVLYGYLRLRNSAPQNSIIIIDEPELHLNPRLVRGLVNFYYKEIGLPLKNQIWLVTHSDTIIRDAVGKDEFGVYHLQPADADDVENQASVIKADEDIERIVVELVGDLAGYKPKAKVVLLEGAGDSEFDKEMVTTLFPKFASEVNAISAGYKKRVNDLYELLETATLTNAVTAQFYAITDKDHSSTTIPTNNRYTWDRYHIENYLIEPYFVLKVLEDTLGSQNSLTNEDDVKNALKACAAETISSYVAEKLKTEINTDLVTALNLNCNSTTTNLSEEFERAITRSKEKFMELVSSAYSLTEIQGKEAQIRNSLHDALNNDDWMSEFKGRDILKRFTGQHLNGSMKYTAFRNNILSSMRRENFEPQGMKAVLEQIAPNDSNNSPSIEEAA